MQLGTKVSVTLTSRPELNSRTWVIRGEGRAGRLEVKSLDDEKLVFSVRLDAIRPLALVPVGAPSSDTLPIQPLGATSSDTLVDFLVSPYSEPCLNVWPRRLVDFLVPPDSEPCLNMWRPLSKLGGNWVMLRLATALPGHHSGSLGRNPGR